MPSEPSHISLIYLKPVFTEQISFAPGDTASTIRQRMLQHPSLRQHNAGNTLQVLLVKERNGTLEIIAETTKPIKDTIASDEKIYYIAFDLSQPPTSSPTMEMQNAIEKLQSESAVTHKALEDQKTVLEEQRKALEEQGKALEEQRKALEDQNEKLEAIRTELDAVKLAILCKSTRPLEQFLLRDALDTMRALLEKSLRGPEGRTDAELSQLWRERLDQAGPELQPRIALARAAFSTNPAAKEKFRSALNSDEAMELVCEKVSRL